MPQTPPPPGEPIRLRDGEVNWFEPVIVAPAAAEPSVVAKADCTASPPQLSLRRRAPPWHEVGWVGFASDTNAPGRADAGAPRPAMTGARVATGDQPLARGRGARGRGARGRGSNAVADRGGSRPEPADARVIARGSQAAAAQRGGAEGEVFSGSGAAIAFIAGAAVRLRQLLRSSVSRLLRLGATAASVGALAVFAYQGGEHLAGLAGATTRPAAPPGRQAAALLAPDGDRAPTLPPNGAPQDPPSDQIEPAVGYLARARAGDPVAQYNIAVLYARGDGVAQDFSGAAAWFREAAVADNVAAQFNLAVIYERGLGVPRNMGEAIQWYRRAAEHDYAAAQYNLAIAYAEGRGVAQDAAAAARWYSQAAAQGLVPAIVNFAILYEKGEGVDRSFADAYAWYRAAARRGDSAAEQRASDLFQQFTGFQKGQAVILADAIAGTIHQPSPEPQPRPVQPPR